MEGQNSLSPEGVKPSGATGESNAFRLRPGREKVTLDGQHDTMDGAKDDESPICAMPEACQDHGNEEISGGFPLALSAST